MSGLRNQDIQQIITLFENELVMLPNISRTDKMKLRRKISNVMMPMLNEPGINAQAIMKRVDSRLEDVLALFFDSNQFRYKLAGFLRERRL